jgi:pimeloyl-ACP methyl ester carboxylesterase
MPFVERDNARIYYESQGSGFPLLLIAGGGLNSSSRTWACGDQMSAPFDALAELGGEFRCVASDLRHSTVGRSSGPMDTEAPWATYVDDLLAVMDDFGADRFLTLGSCIAGPLILKMLERAPARVTAAVVCQPSGYSPEHPTLFADHAISVWGPAVRARDVSITAEMVAAHVHQLYEVRPDFVFSVTREFVRACTTPILVLPDDVPAHPMQISMDLVELAPNASVTQYPWKQPPEALTAVVEHVRRFLHLHDPSSTTVGQA